MNSTLSNPAPAYPRLPQDDAQDDGNGIPENDLQILNVDLNEIIRRLREPAEERTPRADEIEESAEGEENAEEDETSEENESSEEDESSEEEVKEAEKKEMSENVEEEVEEDLFPNLIADIERLLITPPPAKENDGDDEATRDIPQNLPMPSRSEYVPYRGQNPHNSILTVSERNPLLMCRNTDAEDLKALTTPLTIDTSVGNYDPPTGDARVTRDQLLLQPVEPRKNSSTLITSEPMVMDKLPHLMQNFFANNKPGSIAPQLYNPFGADSCFQFSKNYGSGNLDDQRCESQCGQDCDDSPDSASCGRNEDGAEEAENLVGEPEPEQCKFPINENCQMLLARKIQLGPICPPSKAAATDKEPQPLSLPTAPYSSARWMYKESKKSSLDYIEKLVTERQADSICTWPPQVYNMSITCRQQHRLVGHVEDVLEFEPLMPLMALIGADDADNSGRNSPADIGGIPWPPNEEEVVRVPWPRREGDDEPREEPRQEDDEPADAMPIREGNDGAGGQPRREGNDGAGGQPSTGGNDAEGGPVHPPTESNETGARPRSSGNVPVVDDAVAGCSGINVESPRAGPSNDGDEADGAWSLPLMANAEIDEDFLRALWDDDMCRFEPFLVSDPELINEMRKDWENEISQLIAVQTTALRSFDHLFQPPRPGDESRHLRFMNQQEEPAQPSEEDEENKQPTDQPPSDKPMI